MKYENILVFDCRLWQMFSHHIFIRRQSGFLEYNFLAHTGSSFVIGEYEFKKLDPQQNLFYADLQIYEQAVSNILNVDRHEHEMLKDLVEMLTPAVAGHMQCGNSNEFEIVTVSLCYGQNADPNIKSLKEQRQVRS